MIRDNRETTWPVLCALFCLFVLSITAPHVWQLNGHYWSDGGPAIDTTGPIRSISGSSTLSTWQQAPDNGGGLTAGVISENSAELGQSLDLETAISRLGEMQLAAPAPKYASEISGSEWGDLGLPEPVDLVEEEAEEADGREAPEELVNAECPEPELVFPELVEDDHDMSLVDGVAVVLPEEIRMLRAPERESDGWPADLPGRPESLLSQLDELSWDCETGEWARSAAESVGRLGRAMNAGSDEALSIVEFLDRKIREADHLADRLADESTAADVRRAGLSLGRRTHLWRGVISAGGPSATVAIRGAVDGRRLGQCLDRIERTMGDTQGASAWRGFLQLNRLREIAGGLDAELTDDGWEDALTVLTRLNRPGLTERQRHFIANGPIAELEPLLRDLVGGPVNLGRLMEHMEGYETTLGVADAGRLSRDFVRLQLSPVAEEREFGWRLDAGYRQANVRIAVTEELLNRLIPPREEEYEWMRDRVLGVPVSGHQWTDTKVAIRMVPDPERLAMALEIDGLVSSLTSSDAGPATFHSDSESTYKAEKEIDLNTAGLHFSPAAVLVDNVTRLRAVQTDLDGVPLIGSLMREIARSEHHRNRPRIRREVERKVLTRAQRQIDEEAEARLGQLNAQLTNHVVGPLEAMSVGPDMIDARTDEERMAMELRLAGEMHLGSHTPRPWAPSDSLASCQIHESALNNVAAGLELDGRTCTLGELKHHVAERFNRPQTSVAVGENDDVSITFAESDAVGIRFEDGRVEIRLSVAKLRQGRRAWRDFEVRVFYRAEMKDDSPQLVRDGVVQLIGRQNYRSQIALRGIFSSTFSKDRPLPVFPERLAAEPSMAGLRVTQLELADGWLGVALGPQRPASPPSVARAGAEQKLD